MNLTLRTPLLTCKRVKLNSRTCLRSPATIATAVRAQHSDARPEFTEAALAETRQEQWKRYRRSRTWRRIGKFALIGLGFLPIYMMFHPLEEKHLVSAAERDLDKHPMIRQLVEDAATKPLRGGHAEINMEKRVPSTLSDETLKSSQLLGPKRAFWSHSQQELLYFQWFGMLLSGWPTVVHGGAVATAFLEAFSRAAACMEPTSGLRPMHTIRTIP